MQDGKLTTVQAKAFVTFCNSLTWLKHSSLNKDFSSTANYSAFRPSRQQGETMLPAAVPPVFSGWGNFLSASLWKECHIVFLEGGFLVGSASPESRLSQQWGFWNRDMSSGEVGGIAFWAAAHRDVFWESWVKHADVPAPPTPHPRWCMNIFFRNKVHCPHLGFSHYMLFGYLCEDEKKYWQAAPVFVCVVITVSGTDRQTGCLFNGLSLAYKMVAHNSALVSEL